MLEKFNNLKNGVTALTYSDGDVVMVKTSDFNRTLMTFLSETKEVIVRDFGLSINR